MDKHQKERKHTDFLEDIKTICVLSKKKKIHENNTNACKTSKKKAFRRISTVRYSGKKKKFNLLERIPNILSPIKKENQPTFEDPLELDAFSNLKFKRKPFSPYKIQGLFDRPNWQSFKEPNLTHKSFSYSRVQRFQDKIDENFPKLLKKTRRIIFSCETIGTSARQTIGLNQEETLLLVVEAIKKACKYALRNQPSPDMSAPLRAISYNILELLTNLHNIDVPSRSSGDELSRFLIYISDWAAKFMCYVYCKITPIDEDAEYRLKAPSSKLSVNDQSSDDSSIEEEEEVNKCEEQKMSTIKFSNINIINTAMVTDRNVAMNTHRCLHDTSALSSSVVSTRKPTLREEYYMRTKGDVKMVRIIEPFENKRYKTERSDRRRVIIDDFLDFQMCLP